MVKVGSFLGILGGISAILASIAVMWVPGLASIWNGYGWSFSSINIYIPVFAILFSIVNSDSNKLSSGAIIILSCFSFLFAAKAIAVCMWISFAGGMISYISLTKKTDKDIQCGHNYATSKDENDPEKQINTKESSSRIVVASNIGILSGIFGICASVVMAHLYSKNYDTNICLSLLVIIFFIMNLFCNKFASGVIIALSCLGFIYADKVVGICFMISFITAVTTYIPWKKLVKIPMLIAIRR